MKKNKKEELLFDLIDRDLPRFFEIGDETSKSNEKVVHNDRERNHVIITLSKNRNAWRWIDKVYELNKCDYYKAYKETFFSDTPLKNVYSTKTKEYMNKLAGIDNWCRKNGTEEPLLKIVQKEHNKLYSRFKMGIKELDLDKFISKTLSDIDKKNKGKTTKTYLEKHNQVEEVISVALYLATIFDVTLTGFLWKKIMDTYIEDMFVGIKAQISTNEVLKEMDKTCIQTVIKEILEIDYKQLKECSNLYELYNIILLEQTEKAKKTASIMYNDSIEIPGVSDIGKMLAENILSGEAPCGVIDREMIVDVLLEENNKMFADKIHQTEYSSYLSLLFNSLKTTGLDKEVLSDMPVNIGMIESALLVISKCDIEDLYKNKNKINNMLKLKLLVMITNMSMLENYKLIKPSNFGDEEEDNLIEIEKLNEKLNEKDLEINRLKQKIEDLEKSKEKQLLSVIQDLELSNKTVNRLKKELEEAKENQEEFIAMREYIYKNSVEDEIAMTLDLDEISIEEKLNYINQRKIAIFGGHPNWVNKLKKLVPNAMYIDTNAMSSRKFTRLDRYDLLVICNLFISHGLSWKVSEAVKNVKSKKVVIIDDINTDLIINKIYDSIKMYEENQNKLYKTAK